MVNMQEEIVEVEEFSKKGWGTAKVCSGRSVSIPHAVIGDSLLIGLKARKKRGQILEVIKASPERTQPLCKHASICGGCTWQQMHYDAQLRYKQKWIQELFGDIPQAEIYPMLAAKEVYRYRNKMEFSFRENAGGEKYLGLMIAGASKYVFNVEHCVLASSWVSEALLEVRSWFLDAKETAYIPAKNQGNLRTITFREGVNTKERLGVLLSSGEIIEKPFVNALGDICPNLVLRTQHAKKGELTTFTEKTLLGQAHIWEKLCLFGKEFFFKISATSFFQPNTKQAEVLYSIVLSFVQEGDFVCDFYAGTGTISCLAASRARFVIAIENNPAAVNDARENFQKNRMKNIEIYLENVGAESRALPEVDVLIVDPPRMGMDAKALSFIKNISPKKIVYISCNPTTQKENILALISFGYQLKTVQPVDQFPHTYHIENVAYLEKI